MKPKTDPKVDYAFKHVFGREQSKPVLMSLIDAVLQPATGHELSSIDLLNPFNDKEKLDDKLSVLDIKARDQSGRQFNVEMQMLAFGAFRQRALYYWSRLHQSQLQQGMAYEALRPTVAICFLGTALFPDVVDHHSVFELRERHHHALFTDHLQIHILELPKFNKAAEQLTTPLDRWLYFLRHAEALDLNALPEVLDVSELRWALEDLVMISQSEIERERYESRLKAQLDAYSLQVEARPAREKGLEEGRQQGLQEGLQQGLQQGRQQGRQEGRQEGREEGRQEGFTEARIAQIQSFQRILRQEVTASEQLRDLSVVDLENLAARLEAEVNAKLSNGS